MAMTLILVTNLKTFFTHSFHDNMLNHSKIKLTNSNPESFYHLC